MAVLYRSASDSEAQLRKIVKDDQDRTFRVVRAWTDIDARYADTILLDKANDTYYTNIKVDNDSYVGKFMNSGTEADGNDERQVDIIQTLSRVRTVTADTTLTAPIIGRGKNILHPFGEGRGINEDLVFEYRNLDPASDTKCRAFADTTLETKAGSAWDLVERKTQEQDDNTLKFFLQFRQVDRIGWSDTMTTHPDYVERIGPGSIYEKRRAFWFGIDRGHNDSVVVDLAATPAVTNYAIDGYDIRDVGDGANDYIQDLTRINTTGSFFYQARSKAVGNREAYVERVFYLVRDTLAKALTDSGGTATTDFADTEYGDSYTHLHYRTDRHNNQLQTITQMGLIPNTTGNGMWPESVDTEVRYYIARHYREVVGTAGTRTDQFRVFQYKVMEKQDISMHLAYSRFDVNADYEPESHVSRIGDGKWMSYRVRLVGDNGWVPDV